MGEQKNAEKIVELIKNKKFLLELSDVKTDEEALQLFANHGAEVNDEQIKAIRSALKMAMDGDKEIFDGEFENISGGNFYSGKGHCNCCRPHTCWHCNL